MSSLFIYPSIRHSLVFPFTHQLNAHSFMCSLVCPPTCFHSHSVRFVLHWRVKCLFYRQTEPAHCLVNSQAGRMELSGVRHASVGHIYLILLFLKINVVSRSSLLWCWYAVSVNVMCWYNGRKEGNVLFNDTLNTFYLRLYGVGHMVKDHSDSERGNLLPPHGLFFPISSKGSFICTIPQTG